jgi:prepilin-type N-terminal cleavage/methylation domain-containing protein
VQRCRAFTLIEIAISVFILLLLLLLAVPSLNGVLADRRLRRSLDTFNKLVQQAQQLSIEQRRPYLLIWDRADIELRPEVFAKDE